MEDSGVVRVVEPVLTMCNKKWYTWNELVNEALKHGFVFYTWKGSHMVMKKGDRYVHLPYRKKIRKYNFKKCIKKLEKK